MKMKLDGKRGLIFRILIIGMVCILLGITAVLAATNGLSLPWWTTDGGGGASAGGEYSLQGTIGQADAGIMTGGAYILSGGFQSGAEEGPPEYDVYLPAVSHSING